MFSYIVMCVVYIWMGHSVDSVSICYNNQEVWEIFRHLCNFLYKMNVGWEKKYVNSHEQFSDVLFTYNI